MRTPVLAILAIASVFGCEAPVASMAHETDESSGSGSTGDDPDDGAPPGPNDDGQSTTDPSAGDDDGVVTGGHDGDTGANSGGGTGNAGPEGTCAAACEQDADCCPFGALGCPGDAYPDNWSCVDGACRFGGCESDDDCDGLLGLGPEECHEVGGVPTCVAPCDGGGCGIAMQCVGVADDATTFCGTAADAPCETDEDCAGAGVCRRDTGTCVCGSNDDCTTPDSVCDGS